MGKKPRPKPNPNSHKRLRRDAVNSWSNLPSDLLASVYERLGFVDLQRAKSVCPSWHYASRRFVPKCHIIPWLFILPKNNKNNSFTFFNPQEKEKLYRTQDLGVEFAESVCRATYGSWFLMQYPRRYNLCMVNIFTNEKINLPPVEYQLGTTKIERTKDDGFRILGHDGRETRRMNIRSPVFWIDGKSKDYIVLWGLSGLCVVYSKNGDTSWSQIPKSSDCYHMVYKDHKLYFLTSKVDGLKIFDFSEHFRREAFHGSISTPIYSNGTKLVVTVSGDVLKVKRMFDSWSGNSFTIYKVYSSLGFLEDHEEVDSLGDEAMLLDQGITVPANDIEGIKRNSIYFIGNLDKNTTDISVFDLETQKTELIHKFDCSSYQLSNARWFFPYQVS
ncbi:unnamed protein product [Microthlaspi erraticum]|uniref:F-box domain-containing protein n=1 Tax=Microthlaspi erraticum TaxID=1685480 RepID=A0A6D2IWQ0_9BRAS|nr:unnamed protein product [Microthlaspi erraticum]